ASPDAALVRLARVVEGLEGRADLVERVAADPQLAESLAHVVAASSWATDHLVNDPGLLLGLEPDSDPMRGELGSFIGVIPAYASRFLPAVRVGDVLSRIADRVVGHALEAAAPGVPFAV